MLLRMLSCGWNSLDCCVRLLSWLLFGIVLDVVMIALHGAYDTYFWVKLLVRISPFLLNS